MDKNKESIANEWLQDEEFKKFLEEYIEKDAYDPKQSDELRIFITYKALYKIYTATLSTKYNVQKMDEDFAKLDETTESVGKGLASLALVIQEQDRINRAMDLQVKLFSIVIFGLFLLFVYFIYDMFF